MSNYNQALAETFTQRLVMSLLGLIAQVLLMPSRPQELYRHAEAERLGI